jgi:hypothetical protein
MTGNVVGALGTWVVGIPSVVIALVAAAGTWVIGIGAIAAAFKANAIARELKASEVARMDRTGRDCTAGLRVTVLTYTRALRELSQRLRSAADEREHMHGHADAAFDTMLSVRLLEMSTLIVALPSLPETLGTATSEFFALEQWMRSKFEGNKLYLAEQARLRHPDIRATAEHLVVSADQFDRVAAKLRRMVEELEDYLGTPPERRGKILDVEAQT